MRLLHTADWHLGKRLDGHPRIPEQREVLEEICHIAEHQKVDAVLIAGDIFDHFNPSTEAIELLYKTLHRLSAGGRRLVFIIAGNHDSPERIEAPDPLARYNGIVMVGYPNTEVPLFALNSGLALVKSGPGITEFTLPDCPYPLRIFHTSYANEIRLKTYLGHEEEEEALRRVLKAKWQEQIDHLGDDEGVNVLIAHLLFASKGGEIPEEPDDERPILHIGGASAVYTEDIPDEIQYTALGHLHRKQLIPGHNSPVMYSGSPLSYSFAEANQDKYVLLIDAKPATPVQVTPIQLKAGKRLLRKRFEEVQLAAQWLREHPHTWVELTMVSEGYLSAESRKLLENAHSGITTIIPEVKDALDVENHRKQVDLTLDRNTLFARYFKHRYGQEPNEEIMQLFSEILHQNNAS